MTPAAQSELVATYCATCHSERAKAGGLSLAGFNAMLAHESPETAEKMIRKLRAGMMPPAGRQASAAGRARRADRGARIAAGRVRGGQSRIPGGGRSSG